MQIVHGRKLIKNSLLNLFNTMFMLIMTWVISVWVARQLGPSNYGVFTLILWFTGTFSWALGMGLIHAVTKFVAEHKGKGEVDELTPIVLFVLKIEIVLTAVVTVILVFFRTSIANFFFSPQESFYFLLAFLGLLPGVVTAIFSAAIEGIQKFEYFTIASLTLSPLSFLAKVVVLLRGWGIDGILVVMLVFSFANALFYYGVLRREGFFSGKRRPAGKALRRRIHKYNAGVMAILICDKIVWDKSENFFLGRFCPSTEVAYYNLGVNIAQRIMSVLPTTFWRVLFPAMSHYFGSGDRDKMKRVFFVSTRYLAFISFPVGVAGAILSYEIVHFLYGHDYVGAQRVLQIMFLAAILTSLSNPASAILYGYERQGFIYKYGAVLAIVNIVLDLIFIKPFGAVGAASCYAVTTVLGSVGGLLYTCKTMKLKYPIVSLSKIVLATIIMASVILSILSQLHGPAGFLLSGSAGAVTYLLSAFVLGTLEDEDYTLMRFVARTLPRKLRKPARAVISFVGEFKQKSGM